jgi:hypothetical protein
VTRVEDAARLARLLKYLAACPGARRWCKTLTLNEAWRSCPAPEWRNWLIMQLPHSHKLAKLSREAYEALKEHEYFYTAVSNYITQRHYNLRWSDLPKAWREI